jgi:hypothetical protein
MINKIQTNRILWGINALLALAAGLIGVFFSGIYYPVVSNSLIPAVISQDIITVVAAVVMIILVIQVKKGDVLKEMILMGITGYLFYAYGTYTIEQIYTGSYFIYMAIFATSLYSTFYSVFHIDRESLSALNVSKRIRTLSMVYLLINAAVFYLIWSLQLTQFILTVQKPEFTFAIYILDLCFIMPAFIMVANYLRKNRGIGLFLAPMLLLVGFLVLIPLSVTEFLKMLVFQVGMDIGSLSLFLTLSLIFLILSILYFRELEISTTPS